jgi:methanogenic corrinoid protein MtbC1
LNEILQNLAAAILSGSKDSALTWAEKGLQSGIKPLELISGGLTVGLDEVGNKFECGEYYLPDMMLAAEAMSAVLELLAPQLEQERDKTAQTVNVVIGTVKGDLHSIGKDIVIMMLKAAGMEIIDLGVDVPADQFCSLRSR